jgi:hypothetical protein
MAIKKPIILEATGGTAEYHVVRLVGLDLVARTTLATLVSYVSEATFKEGRQPATFQMISVTVEGLPSKGEDPVEFLEPELVAVQPEDADTKGNRYLFAGGTVA